ncbi:hypothetical protein ACEOWJ_004929 [Bacillus cereus]
MNQNNLPPIMTLIQAYGESQRKYEETQQTIPTTKLGEIDPNNPTLRIAQAYAETAAKQQYTKDLEQEKARILREHETSVQQQVRQQYESQIQEQALCDLILEGKLGGEK